MHMRLAALSFGSVAMLFVLAPQAGAVAFTFGCITNNDAGDCAIGEAQLTLDVTDPGVGQVSFVLGNSGPDQITAANIWFDDSNGRLAFIDNLIGTGDVSFSEGSDPASPPGGAPIAFVVDFSADADDPKPDKGVNPNAGIHTLEVLFNLAGGQSFADVIADLEDASSSGMRVAVQAINFASTGSETLVQVPEPSTAALIGLGMLVLALNNRRHSVRC